MVLKGSEIWYDCVLKWVQEEQGLFLRVVKFGMIVSILYKYHSSLTKYSTFWPLINKNIEK